MTRKNIDKTLNLDLESKPTAFKEDSALNKVTLISELTCPKCTHKKAETMPTNACQWFYECEQCHIVIKPKPGDCCVFCSYGSVKCPSIQINNTGCCDNEE